MAESFVQVNLPTTLGKKMKTFENVDGAANTVQSEAVVIVDATTGAETKLATEATLSTLLHQILDANNSQVVTLANAAPGAPWIGTWTRTRSVGFVRQLTVLASNVVAGLGGIFTFQYSEDGVTPTVSETRSIGDFATVRDFDLLNAGEFYRIQFEPDRVLVPGESVFITTTQRRQNDGQFVRLAGQEIEESNAAMGGTFAYLKAFSSTTGKSVNIRPTDISPGNSSTILLGAGATFPGVISSCLGLNGITVFVISDQPGTVNISFGDGVTMGAVVPRNYAGGSVAQGYTFTPIASHFRVSFTNSGGAQAAFLLQTIQVSGALSPIFARIDTPITDAALAQQARAVIVGKTPAGTYENVNTDGLGRLTTTSGSLFARILNKQIENTDQFKDDVKPTTAITDTSVNDGGTTILLTAITSAGGKFKSWHRDMAIAGAGIPAGATIVSVDSAFAATISVAATATAAGVAFTLSASALVHGACPVGTYDATATHDVVLVVLDNTKNPSSIMFRENIAWTGRLTPSNWP